MSTFKNNRILLESGTNEIEIMEFKIQEQNFGINVAKVREIMVAEAVKEMPHAHSAIEGVFKPRDLVITVIDLPKYLNFSESKKSDRDLFVITNFNKMHVAFRVHEVIDIHRISWEAIEKPDKAIYSNAEGIATGLAEFDGRLITVLDFEKIVAEISPETSIKIEEISSMGPREANQIPILVAEDSVLLSNMIIQCLNMAGFEQIIKTENGLEAYEYLQELKEKHSDVSAYLGCIITDIEMPQMDGHRLTKLVKEDPELKEIPLIIFSSLINEENYKKGKRLGANEQLSKPEIGQLVHVMDALIDFPRFGNPKPSSNQPYLATTQLATD